MALLRLPGLCARDDNHALTSTALTLSLFPQDCVFNQLPFPHGMHITEDTVALYSAGEDQKRTPKYMTNLQGGDIHIREIINFLFEASTNIATKECACRVSRRSHATLALLTRAFGWQLPCEKDGRDR